jgi:DNA-binding beta-propeller fold protein YncE/tRNA A-37 threonylcarbamoyl transferase component Bud32
VSEETPAPGEPGIGESLAGYRLEELVGRGGMAVVYRAHDERLGRSVALKVLAPRLALDEAFRRRFIRESQVAASVDHPNIVPIFAAGEAAGYLFIAMRFVQGRDVMTVIKEEGPLPADRACHIVTQVAAALDAAHERGLVHRDVKPANMLRDSAGEDQPDHVYLSDFGLSKHWLSSSNLTSQGEFLGTMDYVAPEQIEGNPVDGRTDQYALACSAFEMLTGAPPFRRKETMAIMWAQVSAEPPALTSRRPDLPAAVDPVMAKALAKASADRYHTCLEFAAALRRACGPAEQPAGAGHAQGVAGVPPVAPASAAPASTPPAPAAAPGQAAAAGAAAVTGPGVAPEPLPEPGDAAGRAAIAPGERPVPPHPPPHSRRARVAVLAACVALLGAIAGGYVLFGGGSGTGARAKTAPGLAAPGCTTKAAALSLVPGVHGHLVKVGGKPFSAVVTSHGYGFVSLGTALAVLKTTGSALTPVRTVPLPAAFGLALTSDQKYLLVGGQNGVVVYRVSALEQDLPTPVAPAGILTSAGGPAVQVALSQDGKYAFAALQSGAVAVFDLRRALKEGFGRDDTVGLIKVAGRPAGITAAPDGLYIYVTSGPASVTSGPASPASAPGQGWLTVIDVFKAEADQPHPVAAVVKAGCGPGQIAVSKTSQDVWVSVTGGNALAVFSAASLLNDPARAVIARVAVGQRPLGMVIFNHGARIMVADSGLGNAADSGLALINVPKALDGRPALVGAVTSGAMARAVVLYPGGQTLLAADGSGTVQTIKVAGLP